MRARRRRRGVPWRSSGSLLCAIEGLVVLVVAHGVAAERVLELTHPAAERLADLGQTLGPEYEQRDDEHDDQLTRPDVVERHGTFPSAVDLLAYPPSVWRRRMSACWECDA